MEERDSIIINIAYIRIAEVVKVVVVEVVVSLSSSLVIIMSSIIIMANVDMMIMMVTHLPYNDKFDIYQFINVSSISMAIYYMISFSVVVHF